MKFIKFNKFGKKSLIILITLIINVITINTILIAEDSQKTSPPRNIALLPLNRNSENPNMFFIKGKNYLQVNSFRSNLQSPIVSETIISVTIYPSFYLFKMEIKYVGKKQPFTQDTIEFPLNFSVISIKSSSTTLNVSYTTNNKENATTLNLYFNRPLIPAETVSVTLNGMLIYTKDQGTTKKEVWWRYSHLIGFQTVYLSFMPNIIFYNSTAPPDQVQALQNGFLQLTWVSLQPISFNTTLYYFVTDEALNEIIFFPHQVMGTYYVDKEIVRLNIFNVGLDAVTIKINNTNWLSFSQNVIVIKALDNFTINIKFIKKGIYTNKIMIETNRTSTPLTITFEISALKTPNSGSPLFLSILLLISLIIGSIGLLPFITKKYNVDWVHFLKSKMESKEQENTISNINVKTQSEMLSKEELLFINNVKKKIQNLQEKEQKVLLYILEHPGCSQQEIAEHLAISKATVSRIVARLVTTQYIMRKRNGMSYCLYLNENRF